jgi:hypothetical protein
LFLKPKRSRLNVHIFLDGEKYGSQAGFTDKIKVMKELRSYFCTIVRTIARRGALWTFQ